MTIFKRDLLSRTLKRPKHNKKRTVTNIILALALFLPGCMPAGYAALNDEGTAAEIYRVNDNVSPGDVFNVYGSGLTKGTRLFAAPLADPEEAFELGKVDVDAAGNFISTRLPDNISAGQYAVWVNDDGEEAIVLNAARPQWLEHVKCAQGQTVRIFGRNLTPAEFGAENVVLVRLTSGAETYFPEIVEANPFAITIRPDTQIPTGTYRIEVSNGNDCWQGLEFLEYGDTLEVVNPIQDPAGLNVWWGDNFNWGRVITLEAENNQDITNALQAAIYDVHTTGGVVRIPAGQFRIGNIKIRDNVILQGAGKDQTTLIYKGGSGAIIQGEYIYGGHLGICDLRFSLLNQNSETPYPGSTIWIGGGDITTQVFVKNCEFDMPMMPRWNGGYRENNSSNIEGAQIKTTDDGTCLPIFVSAASDIIIEGCDITGYMSGPWIDHVGTRYVRVSNCTANTTAGNMHIVGSCVVAENNDLQSDYTVENPYDYNSSGMVVRGPSYVAENRVRRVGKDGHNDGEAIFAENAGTIQACAGGVVEAQGTTIAVNPWQYNCEFDIGYSMWGEWHIIIVDGKGLGQYRVLTDKQQTGNTITFGIDRAWDIVPDATSKFVVMMPIKGATFYKNVAQDCAKGFWFYHDCIDSVMYQNRTVDSSGCLIRSQKSNEFAVSYFNQMIKNDVQGVSRKSKSSAIGEEAILWVDDDVFSIQSYGAVIHGNQYQGDPTVESVPDVLDCAHTNGIYIGHACRIDNLSGQAVKGAVITGNTVRNSETGITIGGSLYPKTWFFENSYLSRGTTNISLADNTFENVEQEYVYPYQTGNLEFGDLFQVYNAVAADMALNTLKGDLLSADIRLKNVSDTTGKFKMILAAYAGNQLVAVSGGEQVNIPIGETGVVAARIDLTECYQQDVQVKAFIWNPEMMLAHTTAFMIGNAEDIGYVRRIVVKGDAGEMNANQNIMLMLLDPAVTDLEAVTAQDIIYMNQGKVNPDGTYTLRTDLYNDTGYTVYVNYGQGNLSQTAPEIQSAMEIIDFSLAVR